MEDGLSSLRRLRALARLRWIWGPLAALALLWPAHVSGPLDGAPLDRSAEALLIGLVFPALWWLYPAFLHRRWARAASVALLLAKIASTMAAEDGWCVRFDPPTPIVRDSTGRPHSWDLRADWRAPNPDCSAVMTHGYNEFKHFPVWFYNLPPVDDGWPTANDRPPYVALSMSVVGFITTPSAGVLDVLIGQGMDMNVAIDGRQAETPDAMTRQLALDAGVHFVQISGTMTGNRWRLLPRWNGQPIGGMISAPITRTRPSTLDAATHTVLKVVVFAIVAGFLGAWLVSLIAWCGHGPTIAWAITATLCLVFAGERTRANIVASPLARWSISALAASLILRVPERLRNVRGAFVLVGLPWLAFVAAGFFDNIGRFSFYTGGEDAWSYQRYAYRVYLQGYWLEGGQLTFWFQPLYRWTLGALHMIFGDSSIGEFYWDGACVLAAALFAHQVVSARAGFRWGLVAAVTVLTVVMQGPTFGYVGRGLTDISSAGLIYMAALVALNRGADGSIRLTTILAAGAMATLAFYTRLNNLPMALAITALAVPLDAPARALFTPRQWFSRTSWPLVCGVVGTLAVGLVLFAWRTWYYTGVFSVVHGTSFGMNAVWQPGQPVATGLRRVGESLMVMLTLNDPPRFAIYALPLLVAAPASALAVCGVRGLRQLPLGPVLFFAAGCSSALVVRGIAYSGRYSTHLLGAGCALAVLLVARVRRQL